MKIRFFKIARRMCVLAAKGFAFVALAFVHAGEYFDRRASEPVLSPEDQIEHLTTMIWKQKAVDAADHLIRLGYTPEEIVGMVEINWHPREYRGLAEAEAAFKEMVIQREASIAEADQKKRSGK